jgi:hypothetical protein
MRLRPRIFMVDEYLIQYLSTFDEYIILYLSTLRFYQISERPRGY